MATTMTERELGLSPAGWVGRVLQSLRERLWVLSRSEMRKTVVFSLLSFLMGFGYICGFFSSNALFLSHVGPSSLFKVYLFSSLLTLALSGIFYFWIDRFSSSLIFEYSFFLLGSTVFGAWALIRFNPGLPFLFFGVRGYFYAVFVLVNVVFWVSAGHHFNHFEARRRYPFLVACWILGDMLGGLWISLATGWLHTENLILIWSAVLILSPFLLLRVGHPDRRSKKKALLSIEKKQPIGELAGLFDTWLPFLLFSFWMIYTFMTFGTDFIFNSLAVHKLSQADSLTKFFGQLTFFASALVLLYQLLVAPWALSRFGISTLIFALTATAALLWTFAFVKGSLMAFTVTQGFLYVFVDHTATARLNAIVSVFPEKLKGRAKIFGEGYGRPAGTLLLFLAVTIFIPHLEIQKVKYLIFGTVLLFLFYPFFFHRVFFRHLLRCIHSPDVHLVSNAIQALGERNKKKAVEPLITLLNETESLSLKRNIILSLGRIRSRESFHEIVELFTTAKKPLQMSAIRALTDYDNYESMFALLRLVKLNPQLEIEVRRNSAIFLTRLMGKKMAPFLFEGLFSDDLRVRANSVEALGVLRDRGMIPVLKPYLNDPHHRIRSNAAVALYPFRATRPEALQVIQELMTSDDLTAKQAGLYAIGILKLKSYEGILVRLLHAKEKGLQGYAAAALGRMKNPLFLRPFLHILLDPDEKSALDIIRHMAQFPSFSRLMVFEEISKLSEEERGFVLSRLDKTPFDFTPEKNLLFSPSYL